MNKKSQHIKAWPLLPLLLAGPLAAQPVFNDVTPTANSFFVTPDEEDFWLNAIAPADIDGDGDLDLAAIGFYVVYNESVEDHLLIFKNQGRDGSGNWTFENVEVPLNGMTAGSSDLAWGDFDGDGDEDLAVGSNGATVIFRNDAGTLAALPGELPGYDEYASFASVYDLRSMTWADVDNDADLDLLLPSVYDPSTFSFSNALLRNDGPGGSGGWVFTEAPTAIEPSPHAQSAWADEDGDGDLDLLLQSIDPDGKNSFLKLFRNEPTGFEAAPLLDFADLDGMVDWADADADGDLDVLVAGNLMDPDEMYRTVLRIYRNDGAAGFAPITLAEGWTADWLDILAATWADYDSDGDIDVLATGSFIGEQEIEGHSKVYTNDGSAWSVLPLELPAPVSSIGRGGAFTWLDLEGDGDLDYLVGGAYYVPNGNGLVEARLKLYLNEAPAPNQPPAAPTGLRANPAGNDGVVLEWNAALDDHTAAAALTYDLEVRKVGSPAAPGRRLPEPGNLSHGQSWRLDGLPAGTYSYSLCAVDSALNSGAKAQGTFTIGPTLLFQDGFETGNTSRWWSTVTP
jgi:hypothetical protein